MFSTIVLAMVVSGEERKKKISKKSCLLMIHTPQHEVGTFLMNIPNSTNQPITVELKNGILLWDIAIL